MNGGDDPYASISYLCRMTSSQEDLLRLCLFADGSDEIPVASNGIMMLSLSESLREQQNVDNAPREFSAEVFHAAPGEPILTGSQQELQLELAAAAAIAEDDEEFEAVDGDSTDYLAAVDLGNDTDSGFSLEAQTTDRVQTDSGMMSSPGVNETRESKGMQNGFCHKDMGKC